VYLSRGFLSLLLLKFCYLWSPGGSGAGSQTDGTAWFESTRRQKYGERECWNEGRFV